MKLSSLSIFFLVLVVVLAATAPALGDSYANTIDTFKKSPQVQPFFDNAYGYAVFPVVGKGGFFIGGGYGKGRVYRRGVVTGTATLIEGSIGFQAGGQAYSEMIFFQDKRAYDEFTSGRFEFDATASAVAITAGVQAQTGTTGTTAGASAGPATGEHVRQGYTRGMAVFLHAKGGLMYEASIGGQKFIFQPN